ncbi:MAG: copper resistance protein B [Proteobacteria bacterium]|nr:copper resistance protein B [Pseudomonadota bacterium]
MGSQLAHNFAFAAILAAAICLSVADDARADMEDDPLLLTVILDQLETRDAGGDNTLSWDGQGWLGRDLHKIWFKTDGERTAGSTDEAELQFLYSKAIARYWDFQLGVRHDFKPSPSRSWAAIGFKGLAPYFFDIDAAAFIGESGRTALRFEAEYELLLTQRLILTPDIEINLYGQNDPDVGIGAGLSDLEVGLRLRYEIRREFAPYIGINWSRLFGNTADFAKIAGEDTSEAQLVIGFRAWF